MKYTRKEFYELPAREQMEIINNIAKEEYDLTYVSKELGFVVNNRFLHKDLVWSQAHKKVFFIGQEFSQEEVDLLKSILRNKMGLEEDKKDLKEPEDVVRRSVIVSKSQLDDFTTWAKKNGMTQTKALMLAMQHFMEDYNLN